MTPQEIKSLRRSLDLSQPEFVEMLGIKVTSPDAARQMASRWERGVRNPSAAAQTLLKQLASRHR
jgi:DNA-binding transcriptional regulator YiaG